MFRFLLLVLLALLVAAGFTAVSAQEATPTPTPAPTSTITIRFVRDGQPVTINVIFSGILAEGMKCIIPITGEPRLISEYLGTWSVAAGPPECRKGPPTTLRYEFNSEFDLLFTEFVWTGDDVTVDIEVPAGMAVPPVELPITGGPPGNAGLTAVSAQEATPTPTSTITVRFVHDGKPLIIGTGTPRTFANGEKCPSPGPAVVVEAVEWSVAWPPVSDAPDHCAQLGAVVRICFGDFCTEVVWQGVDIVVDLEVPDQPDKSAVTARFVKEGQPVQVTLTRWDYEADESSCLTSPENLTVENISSISRFWPTGQLSNPACQIIGSVITAKFSTEEFGTGEGTFVWSGEDVVFDVTLGGAPGELPSTGVGSPADGSPAIDFAVAGFAMILIVAGTLLIYLGRETRCSISTDQ